MVHLVWVFNLINDNIKTTTHDMIVLLASFIFFLITRQVLHWLAPIPCTITKMIEDQKPQKSIEKAKNDYIWTLCGLIQSIMVTTMVMSYFSQNKLTFNIDSNEELNLEVGIVMFGIGYFALDSL